MNSTPLPARRLTGWMCITASLAGLSVTTLHASPAEAPWEVAGRLGVIRYVIVPQALARDAAAYERQLALLCTPDDSCFLNFYTNSTGVPASVPLPDAIGQEATAVYRKSVKQGAEGIRWSCRLQLPVNNCF